MTPDLRLVRRAFPRQPQCSSDPVRRQLDDAILMRKAAAIARLIRTIADSANTSSESCVPLGNKLQVLAILHPLGMRAVERLVDRLLTDTEGGA